jgi:membrane protease YdiL (CAAX protease family)
MVAASAALFGLGHVYQGWKSAVGPAAAGAVLGALYLYTGSLVLPIIVHAVGDYRLLWVLTPSSFPTKGCPRACELREASAAARKSRAPRGP